MNKVGRRRGELLQTYLAAAFIENDFHIQNGAKLLQAKKEHKK